MKLVGIVQTHTSEAPNSKEVSRTSREMMTMMMMMIMTLETIGKDVETGNSRVIGNHKSFLCKYSPLSGNPHFKVRSPCTDKTRKMNQNTPMVLVAYMITGVKIHVACGASVWVAKVSQSVLYSYGSIHCDLALSTHFIQSIHFEAGILVVLLITL